jgi:hypothetical protein
MAPRLTSAINFCGAHITQKVDHRVLLGGTSAHGSHGQRMPVDTGYFKQQRNNERKCDSDHSEEIPQNNEQKDGEQDQRHAEQPMDQHVSFKDAPAARTDRRPSNRQLCKLAEAERFRSAVRTLFSHCCSYWRGIVLQSTSGGNFKKLSTWPATLCRAISVAGWMSRFQEMFASDR